MDYLSSIFIIIFIAAVIIALIVGWWKIFFKAGYPGVLSLLMFIPIINFIMFLVFAFRKWPIQKGQSN